ncbi:MAG TPA: universal stress protein [Streptosporangiaceae bacterium]|nr:universal stress protein [Streptosporangiaceae bacterium]
MPGIVVGVDGSDHSLSALDWALKESDLRKAPLTVITVSPVMSAIYGPGYAPQDYYPAEEESRAQAEKATQQLVSEAIERRGGPPARPVSVRALSGLAADELINASADADLLVVGARGTGGFARLVMGSVSTQVTHHALCPVVVVPGNRGERAA